MHVRIHPSWEIVLHDYFQTDSFKVLTERVRAAYLNQHTDVYPQPENLFRAFNETPFDTVRVVILGQDPYHNPGQAHGLSFSVPDGTPTPPSLLNIFKEIEHDVGVHRTKTDLTDWAQQGVLLLNAVLSVIKNEPTSHAGIGWEEFTDYVIKTISDKREGVVFLLWGSYARSKKALIDTSKHLVLEAPHPSPLSAHRGFLGCGHFSHTNAFLSKRGATRIQW